MSDLGNGFGYAYNTPEGDIKLFVSLPERDRNVIANAAFNMDVRYLVLHRDFFLGIGKTDRFCSRWIQRTVDTLCANEMKKVG